MLNRVILTGRITKDVEVKTFAKGNDVINLSIAVDGFQKDKDGNTQTYFFNLVYWTPNATKIAEYLYKGQLIGVDGKLVQRAYKDKDGKARQLIEINVSSIEFLESKKKAVEDKTKDLPF